HVPAGWPLRDRPIAVHRSSPMPPFLAVATASYPLGSFAMYEAFPCSDYYGPSATSCADRRTMRPPETMTLDGPTITGDARWFPRSLFTVGRLSAQLCSCDIATATPQAVNVASNANDLNRHPSSHPS